MKKVFMKKHLVLNKKNSASVDLLIQGSFGLYFTKNCLLTYSQYKALIFFCKKKVKPYSKLFIRLSPTVKNTTKAVGIRMGKGKGSLDEYYFSIAKGQIFFEFGFKKNQSFIKDKYDYLKLLKGIRQLTILVSKKLAINLKYIISNSYDFSRNNT